MRNFLKKSLCPAAELTTSWKISAIMLYLIRIGFKDRSFGGILLGEGVPRPVF
jgi:hypothetical protein